MERDVLELTNKLHENCVGQDAGVVIGAAFNVVQTAINAIPDRQILSAIAATLRYQAEVIEKMVSGGRH